MNDHADTVRVLRQMREDYGPGLLDYDEKCALDAAIAALEAGRSGEAVGEVTVDAFEVVRIGTPEQRRIARIELAKGVDERHLKAGAKLYAAAPQQPEPMRDYVLDFITNTPEDVTHKRLVELGWTPPQQPPPVGVTDAMVERACKAAMDESLGYGFSRYSMRRALEAALSQQEAAPSVSVAEGLCDPIPGARFGHHPDPAIDFCIEVESLEARMFNARHGIGKPGEQPETVAQVVEAIERAMRFNVGGDEGAVRAKQTLRALERDAAPVPEPAASGEGLSLADRIGFMVADGRRMGINERTIDLDVLEEAARRLTTTGQGDVERLVEDDEDEDCPHCVNGIVPMTMNRPCSHCTPILHTSPLGQQQEGQG